MESVDKSILSSLIKHMKYIPLLLFCLFGVACSELNYEQYVNPLIGTDIKKDSTFNLQHNEMRGQTMPSVGVPHGMTNWVAQTQATEEKCLSPYYYAQQAIQGFRASHWMSGSCTQDYGSVTLMPMTGKLEINAEKRASSFSHNNETATPSYYSVLLDRYNTKVEMTGLSHSGMLDVTFPDNDTARYIIIEPNSNYGEAFIEIHPETREIHGYNPVHRIYQGWGEQAGFAGHFVIRFNEEFEQYGIWNGSELASGKDNIKGQQQPIGAWVKFAPNKKQIVNIKIGTSFTSIANARKNLCTEIPHENLEQVRQEASRQWNQTLSQIKVKGDNPIQKHLFYTALYHANLLPRAFSDVNGDYPKFDGGEHILHADGFTYYCDFSLWDTFRAVQPLLSILSPSKSGDMAQSLVKKGEQGGWLPIFPAWNSYTAAMIGDHGIAMLGDAIMKDIDGFDYEQAYRLMRKNAFEVNTDSNSYLSGKGRRALDSYLQYGFIPIEDNVQEAFHTNEQVSRTLEYAYNDFVLSQVAQKLGKMDDYEQLSKRAQNYKNVINPQNGFAQGRHADSTWLKPFDPYSFAFYICEGTPFHYSWFAPHDVEGLIQHTGGIKAFSQKLDHFFESGHYWHGNEPGHHIPYLYTFTGEPWKTQKLVHEIVSHEYQNAPNGLSGNDDAGQMSAWLVFTMMGFYPICPGSPYYVLGSPFFDEINIQLENGKTFKISAEGASKGNIYIQSATLNGQPYEKSHIYHATIMAGGELRLIMGQKPNMQWASKQDAIRKNQKHK